MARVLVIGGTVFMGRVLVEQLLDLGDDVVIMHRGTGHPFGDRVGEIRCDRNDVDAVQAALGDRHFDIVFDNVYDWQRGTSAEQVSAAAIAVADGVQRYVFTSSVSVYPDGGEYTEDAPLVPSDIPNPYAANKADSERALFELHRRRHLPVSTLRPAFIYGPNNPFARETFFWDRIVRDRPIVIPDDGSRTMQWVHARDVARAAVLAANTDVAVGRAYNLGNYPPVSQVEFVALLAKVAGRTARLVHVPRSRIQEAGGQLFTPPYYFGAYLDVPPITVLPDRARTELGLELTALEDGFRETFQWYEGQQRPEPDFSWEDRLLATAT
ncbi:MAG TPA: NAD-dependent epimerase/dehydratase family protein [Gemmatimonadaceae bacterium]|jgi:nucleoside-diphosphate-sugar epimerase|nr:NAD-dependent epimerase/dehydratase family protein [Gemmatimonadaceae bacterium]